MKIFYFTATGNSLYTAKKIGGELLSIPQLLKEKRFDFTDDAIGFVYPCHGLGLPRVVEEFVKKAKLSAGYFFAVMTYGNVAGSGLKAMEKAASKRGISFDYTNEVLMVDNFIPLFEMGDQIRNSERKNIEEFLYLISNDIKSRVKSKIKKNIFTGVYSGPFNLFMKSMRNNIDKNFIVYDSCTRCGICQKACPAANIKVEKKPVYLHKCDYCMACINICPVNAIHLKNEKSSLRFINEHIRRSEITYANNQQ